MYFKGENAVALFSLSSERKTISRSLLPNGPQAVDGPILAIPRALHANLRFVKNIWTVDKQRNLLFIRRASDIYKCKNCK